MGMIKVNKYLKTIYGMFKEKVIDVTIPLYVPSKSVFCTYMAKSPNTYCQLSPSSRGYRIVFGGVGVQKAAKLPSSSFDVSVAKKMFNATNRILRAFYYHEIGHLIFTDLHCMDIVNYKTPDLVGALHLLFNILEDIVIEKWCMSKRYPYTEKYFNFMVEQVFDAAFMAKYVEGAVTDGPSFLNFLLLKLRRGPAFTGSHAFYTAHEEDIKAHIKTVFMEADPTKRIKNCVVFFEWLLSLGMVFPKMSAEELPFSPAGGKGTGGTPSKGGASEEEAEGVVASGTSGKYAPRGPKKAGEEDESAPPTPEGTPSEPTEDDAEDPEEKIDPEVDVPLDEDAVSTSYNEVMGSDERAHVFVRVADAVRPTRTTLALLDRYAEDISMIVASVTNAIKTFKTRTRPRNIHGYTHGKLHVPSVIEGRLAHVFDLKKGFGLKTDLEIIVLCDHSGSMSGSKSIITTKAMMALARACDDLSIPCEVYSFTAGYGQGVNPNDIITYEIKTAKDTYAEARQYLGVCSSEIVSTYDGHSGMNFFEDNYDEINVYHLWQRIRRYPHRDKVLIVISDGCTIGSTSDLHEVVMAVENDNIHVIGIGVLDSTVRSIYPDHKIFANEAELSGFAEFLGEELFKLSKGSK